MADERILAPIRRFWSDSTVATNYQAIFAAYHSRLEEVTVIIQKGTEGDSASAQVVIQSADYEKWMQALEARMVEIENTTDGITAELEQTGHVNFGNRLASF
jgi:transketolase N-terminal domain/subunit